MEIIETPIFTQIIPTVIPDESYRKLQNILIESPSIGDIIPGSGGIRKLRWPVPGRGKQGGMRVIYYWYKAEDQILMIYAYLKNKQENLTPKQLKALKVIIEED